MFFQEGLCAPSASSARSSRFTITATPTDANKSGWPTLEITERMEVVQR
jgi:hypothetical protein